MFGRNPHKFLYRNKVNVQTPAETPESLRASLNELNRLARLVNLTPTVATVPIYFRTPKISESNDKNQVLAGLAGFVSPTNPSVRLPFGKVFPGTKRPQISMLHGRPKISPDLFTALLASKLSCIRSKLGLNSTPKYAPRLVSSWINLVLSDLVSQPHAGSKASPAKPPPVRKGKKKTPSSEQKDKKNPVIFVPAATATTEKDQLVADSSVAPSPPVSDTVDFLSLTKDELYQCNIDNLTLTDCTTYARAVRTYAARSKFSNGYYVTIPNSRVREVAPHPETLPYLQALARLANVSITQLFNIVTIFDEDINARPTYQLQATDRVDQAHALFVSAF